MICKSVDALPARVDLSLTGGWRSIWWRVSGCGPGDKVEPLLDCGELAVVGGEHNASNTSAV